MWILANLQNFISSAFCAGATLETFRDCGSILLIGIVCKYFVYSIQEGGSIWLMEFYAGTKLIHSFGNTALFGGLRKHNEGNAEI